MQYHLDTLRSHVDRQRHNLVNEKTLLIVAEMLGSIDPLTNEPKGNRYIANDLTEKQAVAILDGLQSEYEERQISPGEAVGVIAGQSLGEPFTQAILRTFHYAGVVKTVSPEQSLTDAVGHHENHLHSICLALKGDYGMDRVLAERVNNKLQRLKLGEFFECTVDYEGREDSKRLQELEDIIHKFEGQRYETSTKFSNLLQIDVEIQGEPLPEFATLLDEAQTLREKLRETSEGLSDSRTIRFSMKFAEEVFNKKERKMVPPGHGWRKREDGLYEPEMGVSGLRAALTRIMKTSRNKLKSVTGLPGFYESVRFFDDGDDVLVTYPQVSFTHIIDLTELIPTLDLCGGCFGALKAFKLDPERDLAVKKEKVIGDLERDLEFDLTKVEKYLREILDDPTSKTDIKTNPPPDNPIINKKRFGWQEVSYDKCCPDCGGGWWNTSTALYQVGGGDYTQGWGTQLIVPPQHDYAVMTDNHIEFYEDETNPRNWFPTERMAQIMVPWPYSRPGAISDMPMIYNHSGFIPASPSRGEYFIITRYANPELLKETKWGQSKKSNKPPGHFANARMFLPEVDFYRSSTNDVHQTHSNLGIEAARTVLLQNLYATLSGGKKLAGADAHIDLAHYTLLADTMTHGPDIIGAPTGTASRAGAAATKGGGNAVLAVAYEQEVKVLFDAASRGIVEPLDSPKSSQIAGLAPKMGSGMFTSKGRFSPTESLAIENAKAFVDTTRENLQMAAMQVGFPYFTTADPGLEGLGVHQLEITPGEVDMPEITKNLLKGRLEQMMENDEFVIALQEYRSAFENLRLLMEESFDSRGVPANPDIYRGGQ